MYFLFSKILSVFILPRGLTLILSVLALVLLFRRKFRLAFIFFAGAISVFWVSSMPVVGNAMMAFVEQKNSSIEIESIPARRCVVVLGGGSLKRFNHAKDIFLAGKVKLVIVAGANASWFKFEQYKAQANIPRMPVDAVLLENDSRNTRENAVNVKPLLLREKCGKPLLVTSASHMKRATRAFAKIGVEVVPAPTSFRAEQIEQLTGSDFLPNVEALDMTSDAIYELIGSVVYRLRGWN